MICQFIWPLRTRTTPIREPRRLRKRHTITLGNISLPLAHSLSQMAPIHVGTAVAFTRVRHLAVLCQSCSGYGIMDKPICIKWASDKITSSPNFFPKKRKDFYTIRSCWQPDYNLMEPMATFISFSVYSAVTNREMHLVRIYFSFVISWQCGLGVNDKLFKHN